MKLNKINVKKYLFLVLLLWLSTLYLFAGDFISFQFFGLDCQCSEPAFYEVGSICILFFILLGLLLPYAEIKKAHNHQMILKSFISSNQKKTSLFILQQYYI